jgi:glycosyltransferase involved in cell wall biosynthesis
MDKLHRPSKFRFIWVGGPVEGRFFNQLQYDIRKSNLQDAVTFVGPCERPEKYYSAMDVFLLPSREDPCPLVMLEAAGYGLPIVCFEGSGGAPEFAEDDTGVVVPYLDVEAMAGALFRLQGAPELAARLGESGRRRTIVRHDPEQQCQALFSAITRIVPMFSTMMRT